MTKNEIKEKKDKIEFEGELIQYASTDALWTVTDDSLRHGTFVYVKMKYTPFKEGDKVKITITKVDNNER